MKHTDVASMFVFSGYLSLNSFCGRHVRNESKPSAAAMHNQPKFITATEIFIVVE